VQPPLGDLHFFWALFLLFGLISLLHRYSIPFKFTTIVFNLMYLYFTGQGQFSQIKEEKKKTVVDVTSFYFSICIKGKG
jgi:hypothetical protein